MRSLLLPICGVLLAPSCAKTSSPGPLIAVAGEFCKGDCPPWDRVHYDLLLHPRYRLDRTEEKDVYRDGNGSEVVIQPLVVDDLDEWSFGYDTLEEARFEGTPTSCTPSTPNGTGLEVEDERSICTNGSRSWVRRLTWDRDRGLACRADFQSRSELIESFRICDSMSAHVKPVPRGQQWSLAPAKKIRGTIPIESHAPIEFELQLPVSYFEVPKLNEWGGRTFASEMGSPLIMIEPRRDWSSTPEAIVRGDTTIEEGWGFVEVDRPIVVDGVELECHVELPVEHVSLDRLTPLVEDAVRVCKSLELPSFN